MRERRNSQRRQNERRSGFDRRKENRNTPDRRQGERRQSDRRQENIEKKFDDQVEGRNSVLELLESGRDINKIFVTRGEKHGDINKIAMGCKKRRVQKTGANCRRCFSFKTRAYEI